MSRAPEDGDGSQATTPQRFAGAAPAALPGEGERINPRYRLGEVIGRGVTGPVHAADDLAFGRQVAVKILGRSGGEATAHFLREARLTAQLDHPSVVPVHDLVWMEDGGVAFAMKRIEGLSLREAILQRASGRGPEGFASINDVVTVFLKICDGIARAHAKGVVHRDIKPDNIIIGQFGEVIVLDWGEAHSGEDPPAEQGSPVGTPLYMSPEQARGEAADAMSDVYGIGATLFHALVGRPILLLGRDEPERFWERRRQGDLDLPQPGEAAACDRRLLAIALKCLYPAAAERYPAARALAADLAAFQAGQAVTAYREGLLERLAAWHRRHARTLWLTAALLLTVLVLGASLLGDRLERLARWGEPVQRERFAAGWSERWVVGCTGEFEVADGRAVSRQGGEGTLMLQQELPPHTAIEFTGMILPDQPEQDLSVFWVEGPAVPAGKRWPDDAGGWMFQVGTWDNTCCVLRSIRRGVVAYSPVTLRAGVAHRIRAEIDGDRQRLQVDGRTIFENQDAFGANPGRWFLYTCGPGKAFSEVDIYVLGAARLVSASAVPDALRVRGLLGDAAVEYRRLAVSHAGSAFADRARYKEGLTWGEQGDWASAQAAWSAIADRDLRETGEAMLLAPLATADPNGFCTAFEERWREYGEDGRKALIGQWNAAAQVMFERTETAIDGGLADRFFALRRRYFPAAGETDLTAARAAGRTGRMGQLLPMMVNPWVRAMTLEQLAGPEAVVREGTILQRQRAERMLQAAPATSWSGLPAPGSAPAWWDVLRREGPAAARSSIPPTDAYHRAFLDRAYGDPRDSFGRFEEQAALIACLWLDATAQGRAEEATRWRDEVRVRDPDRTNDNGWVPALLVPIGILAGEGRLAEARAAAARVGAVPASQWRGSATAWAAALQAPGDPPEALPRLPAGGLLARALRADLAGDLATATAAYRAWFAVAWPNCSMHLVAPLRLARWRAGPGPWPGP